MNYGWICGLVFKFRCTPFVVLIPSQFKKPLRFKCQGAFYSLEVVDSFAIATNQALVLVTSLYLWFPVKIWNLTRNDNLKKKVNSLTFQSKLKLEPQVRVSEMLTANVLRLTLKHVEKDSLEARIRLRSLIEDDSIHR